MNQKILKGTSGYSSVLLGYAQGTFLHVCPKSGCPRGTFLAYGPKSGGHKRTFLHVCPKSGYPRGTFLAYRPISGGRQGRLLHVRPKVQASLAQCAICYWGKISAYRERFRLIISNLPHQLIIQGPTVQIATEDFDHDFIAKVEFFA